MAATTFTVLIALLAAQIALCAPANLVRNPGFEGRASAQGIPTGWWRWEQTKGESRCALDSDVKHSGAHSLRVTLAKPGNTVVVAPDIAVAVGETFDVSVWVRVKGFQQKDVSGTVVANAAFRDSRGKFVRFVRFGKVVPEGEWVRLKAEAKVPPGIGTLTFELGLKDASGTVWFDDVSVTARSQYAIRPAVQSDEIPPGKSKWPVGIINRTGEKREARLEAWIGSGGWATTIRLDGSGVQRADVELNAPRMTGARGPLRVRLSDVNSNQVLAELNVDHLRVMDPVELEPLVPTHFCVEDGKPTLEARVWNHLASGEAKALTVTLADSEGTILDTKAIADPKSGWQDVKLSSDKAVLGNYTVEARITGGDGKAHKASQPWHVIHRSQARVIVNDAGFPVADGKPVFVLSTFNSGRYDLMAKTGFTVTHAWNRMKLPAEGARTDNQQALDYLDETESEGMKAIGFLHAAYMERQDWRELRRRIRMFRNHPALLAWDQEEGVARGEVPMDRLEKLVKIVREEDKNHPFVQADSYDVINKVDRKRFFREDLTDIGMWWYYPIPLNSANKADGLLGREAEDGLTLNPPSFMVSTKKPVWLGMQAYAPDVPGGRMPTDAEFRCMAYLGIVNGAKGLIYYMGGSAGLMPGCKEDRPWGYLQTLVPELHSLIPVFLSPTASESVSVDAPLVSTLLKRTGQDYTLIAVNRSDKAVEVTIKANCLPSGELEVLFESRKQRSEAGALKDHLVGYGVHVYRWRD